MKKGGKILITVLILIIVGLVTFIVFDKFINKKEENTAISQDNAISSGNDMYNNVIENHSNINYDSKDYIKKDEKNTNKISLTKKVREVRKITGPNANFICKEQVPTITGVSDNVAKNIENSIKSCYNAEWTEDINPQTSDEEINKLLENEGYDIGFELDCEIIFSNEKVATIEISLSVD